VESRTGPGDIYPAFETLDEAEVVRNPLELRHREDVDVDAVAVGNTFDPGVHQARAILDIFVLGIFETALLSAHLFADRFAVVADVGRITPALRRQVHTYGLGRRVAGIYGPDVSLETIGTAFEEEQARQDFLDEYEACVKRAVDDGADLVIPGGGVVPVLLHHMEDVSELHGVPILDKTAVLIKQTEAMADLYADGLVHTSRSGAYESPSADELADLEARYEIHGED
jgi:Asp/Glu/hydantoin racemase